MSGNEVLPFVYALAIGLLLGFERERSHRGGPAQAEGSRTFALLGLLGALTATFGGWAIVFGLVAVSLLLAVGYRRTSADDPGTTTEMAALATYLLGALAVSRAPLAAGLAVIAAALLVSKGRIHAFARDIVTDTEMEDAVKFLVVVFVVLPLLPDQDVGPYGVLNPRRIWLLVVALTGISWVGYIVVRAFDPRRGLMVTGLAGGFVSATATTGSMGRLSRTATSLPATVAGAQIASIATLVQLAAIVAVVNRTVVEQLWPSLVAGALVLSTIVWWGYRHADPADTDPADTDEAEPSATQIAGRAFVLAPAMLLAGILTLALLVSRWGAAALGPQGAVLASGAAGLADAHAGAILGDQPLPAR